MENKLRYFYPNRYSNKNITFRFLILFTVKHFISYNKNCSGLSSANVLR